MGYDLHIVRRNDWENYEEASNISLEEWLAFVRSDDELELANGYQVNIPGVPNAFQNVPGFCNWTGHSTKVRDDKPWFDYGHGMISAKYPDDETIKKMIKIAENFKGKVQGDDGEFYDENHFSNNNDQVTTNKSSGTLKKSWWKLW